MLNFKKILKSESFVLLILFFFSLIIRGYRFGVSVHRYYFPFIFKSANENLYSKDFIFNYNTENSLLFNIIGKISNYLNFEMLMFILYSLFSLLFVIAIYKLSSLLSKNKYVGYITVLLLMISKPSFGTDLTFRDMFFPITASIPLLLFSIYLFIKEKYIISFILVGISFNMHGLSSSYIFAIYLIYFMLSFRNIERKKFMYGLLLFALLTIPLIVFSDTSNLSFYNADSKWIDILKEKDQSHTFPSNWSFKNYRPIIPLILLGVFVFLYCYNKKKNFKDGLYNKKITYFILGIFILLIFSITFVEIYPIEVVIALQIFRSTLFLMIFILAYTSLFIHNMLKSRNKFNNSVGLITFSALFFYDYVALTLVLPFIFLSVLRKNKKIANYIILLCVISTFILFLFFNNLINRIIDHISINILTLIFLFILFFFYKFYKSIKFKKMLSILLIIFLIFASFVSILSDRNVSNLKDSFRMQFQFPSYIKSDYKLQMEEWIKQNTEINSLFLAPADMYEFRSNTQRSVFVTSGIFNGHYSKELSYEWKKRENEIGINSYLNLQERRFIYNNLSQEKVDYLKNKYNITHAVFNSGKNLNYTIIYSNREFIVFCLICHN